MANSFRKRRFEDLTAPVKRESQDDTDFLYVCSEIDISETTRDHLQRLGIDTMAKLLDKKEDLKANGLKNMKKSSQKDFYEVCLWHDSFSEEKDRPVVWRDDFNEDIFSNFQKNGPPMTTPSVLRPADIFAVAKSFVHGDGDGELSHFSEADVEAMYEWAANKTIEALSTDLKDKCIFDVKEFAILWYRAIFSGKQAQFDIHGHTQSGKSTLKALAFAICEMVSLPLIVITKGVAESKDLKKKITGLLAGCAHKSSPTGHWWKNDIDMLYVIADTAAQINRAVRRIEDTRKHQPNLKFALILDECDAMYRTSGRDQKTEIAFDDLMDLGPSLPIFITATPLPAWLTHICRQGLKDITMLKIGTTNDYSGVNDLRPIQDDNGDSLFLRHGDISRKAGVPYSCKVTKLNLQRCDKESLFPENDKIGDVQSNGLPSLGGRKFIPYTNDDVMRFYDDALSDLDTKKGILLLDSTCPSVQAENNIFDKSCCIQNHYRTQGKDIAVVVIVGKGIFIRRPGFKQGRFTKRTMSEVIQRLDDKYGLDLPIFVFGYSKMRRCISYRSEHRVPTHMVLMLGQGQSNENFIQAIGRATFNGLEALKRNGHENPKILTNEDDFLMALKYGNYMEKVHARRNQGDTALEALLGQNELFTDEENFLLHSNRKTGQDKTLASLLPTPESFVEPSASDHVNKKKIYWDDTVVQKVLRAFSDLYHERHLGGESPGESQTESQTDSQLGALSFTVDEILEMYNDTYHYMHVTLKKGELRKVLTRLNKDVVIRKAGKDPRGGDMWTAKSMSVLKDLLNPKHCEN